MTDRGRSKLRSATSQTTPFIRAVTVWLALVFARGSNVVAVGYLRG